MTVRVVTSATVFARVSRFLLIFKYFLVTVAISTTVKLAARQCLFPISFDIIDTLRALGLTRGWRRYLKTTKADYTGERIGIKGRAEIIV